MTLINNSPDSLSGEYEMEDTDIFNGAIIQGYENNGSVVGHYSNGGGGNCYLELEDGTQVNSYYGSYSDVVTEYSGDSSSNRTYKHTLEINCLVDTNYIYSERVTLIVYNNESAPYENTFPPEEDMIGCTLSWNGWTYTIQSFNGSQFTMTDGTELLLEYPGEVSDIVTNNDSE